MTHQDRGKSDGGRECAVAQLLERARGRGDGVLVHLREDAVDSRLGILQERHQLSE